jgi:hypothetical protein
LKIVKKDENLGLFCSSYFFLIMLFLQWMPLFRIWFPNVTCNIKPMTKENLMSPINSIHFFSETCKRFHFFPVSGLDLSFYRKTYQPQRLIKIFPKSGFEHNQALAAFIASSNNFKIKRNPNCRTALINGFTDNSAGQTVTSS